MVSKISKCRRACSLGKLVSGLAGLSKCQSIRGHGCHCSAWVPPPPAPHCGTNKGLQGFTVSSETQMASVSKDVWLRLSEYLPKPPYDSHLSTGKGKKHTAHHAEPRVSATLFKLSQQWEWHETNSSCLLQKLNLNFLSAKSPFEKWHLSMWLHSLLYKRMRLNSALFKK